MIDERAYWIWLQQAFGAGSPKPMKIHRQYAGGVKEFCQGGAKLWNTRRDLTDKEALGMHAFSLEQAQARLEYAQKLCWQVLTPTCEEYPPLLREIDNPPAVLYGKGTLPDWTNCLPISIAGSRKASRESVEMARKLGYELATGGACVVSGGAEGVDAAALTGAITLPGAKVISVLPVSLDSNYVLKKRRVAAVDLRARRRAGDGVFFPNRAAARDLPAEKPPDYRHEPWCSVDPGGEKKRNHAVCRACVRPK